jgi:hypothetical protein
MGPCRRTALSDERFGLGKKKRPGRRSAWEPSAQDRHRRGPRFTESATSLRRQRDPDARPLVREAANGFTASVGPQPFRGNPSFTIRRLTHFPLGDASRARLVRIGFSRCAGRAPCAASPRRAEARGPAFVLAPGAECVRLGRPRNHVRPSVHARTRSLRPAFRAPPPRARVHGRFPGRARRLRSAPPLSDDADWAYVRPPDLLQRSRRPRRRAPQRAGEARASSGPISSLRSPPADGAPASTPSRASPTLAVQARPHPRAPARNASRSRVGAGAM